MDSVQLTRALGKLKTKFYGVFPSDKLPRFWIEQPTTIIANTDPSNLPGTHWVAIYVNKKKEGIFFNSYGTPPHLEIFEKRMRENCKSFKWNTKTMQSPFSNVCGQYCIMFLWYMLKGYSLRRFCAKFTKNYILNDRKVSQFYKRFMCNKKRRFSSKKKRPVKTYYGKGSPVVKYNQCCVPSCNMS